MSLVFATKAKLTAIANAIRTRAGSVASMTLDDMADAIPALPNTYAVADEGKVVDNGALVSQTSDIVTENDTYDTTLINSLTVNVSGGDTPAEIAPKDVIFIDYDGTVVYTYTAQEFLALSAMPANPSHDGLTAQGWNWTFADAKSYVQNYGVLVVGQHYTTSDGKTRIYINIDDADFLSIPVYITLHRTTESGGVTIDWGDGSTEITNSSNTSSSQTYAHTYSALGEYTITLNATSGTMQLGYSGNDIGWLYTTSNAWSEKTAGWVRKIEIGNNVSKANKNLFTKCRNLESVSLPSGLSIENGNGYFFRDCLNLKAFVFPDGFENTRDWLTRAYGMEYIAFPKTITTVGGLPTPTRMRAITLPPLSTAPGISGQGAYNIRLFSIPGTYSSIPGNFCRGASGVEKIVIPATVTSIADYAFTDSLIKEYHLLPSNPPTLANTRGMSAKTGTIIYVPYSADHSILNAYKSASNWSTFASYMQEEPQ